jgi:hypothetical protein
MIIESKFLSWVFQWIESHGGHFQRIGYISQNEFEGRGREIETGLPYSIFHSRFYRMLILREIEIRGSMTK